MPKNFKEHEQESEIKLSVQVETITSETAAEHVQTDPSELLNKLASHVPDQSKLDKSIQQLDSHLSTDGCADDFISLEQILSESEGPLALDRSINLVKSLCNHLEMRTVSHGALTPKVVVYADDEALIDDFRGGWLDSMNVYKAPEALRGGTDQRVDVYSIGVMFYEMLTNKNRCPAQTDKSKQLLTEKQLQSSPIWNTVPAEIRAIILKCLKKSPGARYKNAAALRKALIDYSTGKPASAPPSPFWSTVKSTLATVLILASFAAVYLYNQKSPEQYRALVEPPTRIVKHNETPLSEKELAVLSKYNTVILLDRSGSMQNTDCGSTNSSSKVARGSTRWDWTENELENLVNQSSKILPNGFDVITWNDTPELFENCKVDELGKIYTDHAPEGGNNLGTALVEAFKVKFPTQKPLLVAIVTDGDPDDLRPSETAIVDRLGAEKVGNTKVVFLRVGGNNSQGEQMLKDLDSYFKERLPDNPAVSTVNFPQLADQGLGRSLVESVENEKRK